MLVTLSLEAVEVMIPARAMMATTTVIICMKGSVLILKSILYSIVDCSHSSSRPRIIRRRGMNVVLPVTMEEVTITGEGSDLCKGLWAYFIGEHDT